MPRDQFNADAELAARKAEFERAAKPLIDGKVPLLAQLVADEISGAVVESVVKFNPDGESVPRVTIINRAELLYKTRVNARPLERWTQASLTVSSYGGRLELSRWESSWSQKPGGKPDRATASCSAKGEINFDPKNGIKLLQRGLESEALFHRR